MTHWHDPKTEKPEDGEDILIRVEYYSIIFQKVQVRHEVITYNCPFRVFEKQHTPESQTKVTHWLRIPPVNND